MIYFITIQIFVNYKKVVKEFYFIIISLLPSQII